MKIEQNLLEPNGSVTGRCFGEFGENAQLVFAFGGTAQMRERAYFDRMKASYPRAHILGCSTAGEICDTSVFDDTLVVTAVQLEKTAIDGVVTNIHDVGDSFKAGAQLAKALGRDGLVHVFSSPRVCKSTVAN